MTNIGERVIYAATGQLEELNVQRPLTDSANDQRRTGGTSPQETPVGR